MFAIFRRVAFHLHQTRSPTRKPTLDISDDFYADCCLDQAAYVSKARNAIALAIDARGFAPLGKAVEIAAMTRVQFERWLVDRKVERPFSEDELEKEPSWADSIKGRDGSGQAALPR